jgi:hypothetical protein
MWSGSPEPLGAKRRAVTASHERKQDLYRGRISRSCIRSACPKIEELLAFMCAAPPFNSFAAKAQRYALSGSGDPLHMKESEASMEANLTQLFAERVYPKIERSLASHVERLSRAARREAPRSNSFS